MRTCIYCVVSSQCNFRVIIILIPVNSYFFTPSSAEWEANNKTQFLRWTRFAVLVANKKKARSFKNELLFETDTIRRDGRKLPVCSLCGACVHFRRPPCRRIGKIAAHCSRFFRPFTPFRIVSVIYLNGFISLKKIKLAFRRARF